MRRAAAILAVVLWAGASPAPTTDKTRIVTREVVRSTRAAAIMTADAAPRHTNRLAKEKSPYLLQHAHNPVDWYPWGPEALEKAQREGKPIFLSIGYSTCHWCHVMEKESFENEDIARVMNEHFVSIKVDREERPDVDHLYMTAVMAMTGQGGWPMSTFLTPDGRPFYGGTYFPPDDRYGRPGFKRLLLTLADAWKNKRDDLLATAGELTRILHEVSGSTAPGGGAARHGGQALDASTLKTAFGSLRDSFDEHDGGFGGAPKFPRPHALTFLLRYHARVGDPTGGSGAPATAGRPPLHMVEVTLDRMASGGIHDQIGGGFHRYSTDGKWLVPHFEKMLYDQALLARAYLEAHQVTRARGGGLQAAQEYARVARRIFEYVLRDLTDPAGGFYSAEDADSEGVEGKFYVWTPAELERALGSEDGKRAAKMLGVTKEGNFEHGWSILHLPQPVTGLDRAWLDGVGRKLLEVRSTRIRPHRDDKVLASWNGLMISALAYGAQVLDDPRYAVAASRAADFVLTKMRRPDGRLLRRYRAGEAAVPGFLDDYAFMALGLLDLYEATFDPLWLKEAKAMAGEMVRLFRDDSGAAFYDAAADAEKLVARPRDLDDGAVPSGNSVAALVLLRLGRLTADEGLEAQGRRVLTAVAGMVSRAPSGFTQMLAALDFSLGPTREIVIAGDPAVPGTQALVKTLRGAYLPRSVVALHPVGTDGKAIEALIPYIAAQGPVNGKPAAYVCENYACLKPVTSPAEFSKLLNQ